MELKKKSIPFIMECNACLIKDKLVSQNPMEIILLPQKSWIRPKQILTLKRFGQNCRLIGMSNEGVHSLIPTNFLVSVCQAVSSVCLNSSGQQDHITALSYTYWFFGSFQIYFVLSVFGTTKLFWALFKIAIAIKINNYPKPNICN